MFGLISGAPVERIMSSQENTAEFHSDDDDQSYRSPGASPLQRIEPTSSSNPTTTLNRRIRNASKMPPLRARVETPEAVSTPGEMTGAVDDRELEILGTILCEVGTNFSKTNQG